MDKQSILPVSELRKLISYNHENGVLTWLDRPIDLFPCERTWRGWNQRFSGKPALNGVGSNGYRMGSINYRKYLAHRVAFALHYGRWPKEHIDHANGVRTDNRICNLREASASQNMQNSKAKSRNTSGYKGVTWDKSKGKWQASIRHNGKSKFLGRYDDPKEAFSAYCEAAKRYHGEFARTE